MKACADLSGIALSSRSGDCGSPLRCPTPRGCTRAPCTVGTQLPRPPRPRTHTRTSPPRPPATLTSARASAPVAARRVWPRHAPTWLWWKALRSSRPTSGIATSMLLSFVMTMRCRSRMVLRQPH